MIIKSARITSIPRDFNSIVQSLIYALPDDRGHIFALYQISGRRNTLREKAAIVLNEHVDRYRQTLQSTGNVARKFEQMVQALNDQLFDLSQDFQQFPLNDFEAVIGVVTQSQLFLTGFGQLEVVYMHKTSKERFTIYNLGEQFAATESSSWQKAFVTVLDGELHENDIFYVATPISQRELAHSELQEIISTLPPNGALKRIEQFIGAQMGYGAICFKFAVQKDNRKKKINPISSIQHLGQTKDDTAILLGEGKSELSTTIVKLFSTWSQNLHQPGERNFTVYVKNALRTVLKLASSFILLVTKLYNWLKPTIEAIRNKITALNLLERAKSAGISVWHKLKGIKQTSVKFKIGVIVISVLAISSVFSLRNLAENRQSEELMERFRLIESTIIEKKDQAEARMIFKDTDSARSLLTEALTLVDTLPSIRSEVGRVDQLRNDILALSSNLQGILRPELSLIASAGDEIRQISLTTGGLVAMSNNAIFRLNSVTNEFTRINNGTIGNLEDITSLNGNFFVVDSQRQLARIQNDSLVSTVSGVNRLLDVSTLHGYNDSLYVLSPSAEQIIRMRAQGDQFEAGTPWIIARNSSIARVTDMSIDGDVYLLEPERVLQYRSGRELNFKLQAIDPPLNNATRLETAIDMRYIYILEPSLNRIVVIDKNGNFVKQYMFSQLSNMQDFAIDEAARTGYIASDKELYRFTLEHLLQ
jgi:hypothetical protein